MKEIISYGRFQCSELSPHKNRGMEITYVEKGLLEWMTEGVPEKVKPGSIYFTLPWQVHGSVNPQEPDNTIWHVLFHLENDYPPVAARNLPRADAIVLLGGAIRGEVSPETLADMSGVGDRLVFAVAVFKAGKAPVVLVTGGAREGEVPEASLIRNILMTMGVPQEKIVLETRNRVTRDNRRFTQETLAGMGVESALLVTSAFHMHRAILVFEPLDLTVYPAPSDYQVLMSDGGPILGDFLPSVKALQRTTWAFHEQVGYWYYKLVA